MPVSHDPIPRQIDTSAEVGLQDAVSPREEKSTFDVWCLACPVCRLGRIIERINRCVLPLSYLVTRSREEL